MGVAKPIEQVTCLVSFQLANCHAVRAAMCKTAGEKKIIRGCFTLLKKASRSTIFHENADHVLKNFTASSLGLLCINYGLNCTNYCAF